MRQTGLTIVGDVRGATTSTVNTMLEALYLFEVRNIRWPTSQFPTVNLYLNNHTCGKISNYHTCNKICNYHMYSKIVHDPGVPHQCNNWDPDQLKWLSSIHTHERICLLNTACCHSRGQCSGYFFVCEYFWVWRTVKWMNLSSIIFSNVLNLKYMSNKNISHNISHDLLGFSRL